MLNQINRNTAWLADLAVINAQIEAHGMPAQAPRSTAKRGRIRTPLWEE